MKGIAYTVKHRARTGGMLCGALVGIALFAGCDSATEPDPGPDGGAIATVEIDRASLTLSPDESWTPALIVRTAEGAVVSDPEVAWSSSNSAVATVTDAGVIQALAPGTATIRAVVDTAEAGLALDVVRSFTGAAAGWMSSCGITPTDRLYCWGGRYPGHGSTAETPVPVLVAPDLRWSGVSAGVAHKCGVTVDGDGFCWGANVKGYLGDGTYETRLVPVTVSGGLQFGSITAGRETTCGVTTGGDAYCWGQQADGRLGNGETSGLAPEPQLVLGGHQFTEVGVGTALGCGLTTGGDIYCWGGTAVGTSEADPLGSLTPVIVAGGHQFIDLAIAFNAGCGLAVGGELWCWGQNRAGLVGPDDPFPRDPIAVAPTLRFSSIVASPLHMCGLTADGRAYCWGDNANGQLGYETAEPSSATPQPVSGDHTFVEVTAGEDHSCGVTGGGAMYCWGAGGLGQLGDGDGESSTEPVRVLHPGE